MASKKACFLLPLYDNRDHFARAVELVNSFQTLSPGQHMAILFSYQSHLDKFMTLINNENIIPLLLPSEYLKYSSQIVVKKLVGTKLLTELGYDFVAVIDAESVFIKPVNTLELCKEIWKQPIIGNLPSETAALIVSVTVNYCGISQEDIEKYKLRDYYIWFNEIPVYEKKTFDLFWKWLFERQEFVPDEAFDNPNCCDYVLYAFYLITHGIKQLKAIPIRSNQYGLLEEFESRDDIDRHTVLEQMGTHWCRWPMDKLNELESKPKIKMLFNMDRDKQGGSHGYSWGYWLTERHA